MYTTNPNMPKVRLDAVNMVKNGHSIRMTARYFGFQPSTILKWTRKTPDRYFSAGILTKSSRPLHSPLRLSSVVYDQIVAVRRQHNRCAEVVHKQLLNQGVSVSLSTVKRTLDRKGLLRKRSPWKRRYISLPRPFAENPGDLVQIDTIHIVSIYSEKFYVYTMIDVFSRWAYAMVSSRINTHQSLKFVKQAMQKAPFKVKTLQSDNGQEFSSWFTENVQKVGLTHRHSRVRKPNDNSHVERFNRTIKEECLNNIGKYPKTFEKHIKAYLPYYNSERLHLGINLLTPLQVLPSY